MFSKKKMFINSPEKGLKFNGIKNTEWLLKTSG